jgi:hypothetical protein
MSIFKRLKSWYEVWQYKRLQKKNLALAKKNDKFIY